MHMWSFARQNRDSNIGANALTGSSALLSFSFIHCRSSLNIPKFVAYFCCDSGLSHSSFIFYFPCLEEFDPHLPSPGALLARHQGGCSLKVTSEDLPLKPLPPVKISVSLRRSHWILHFSFIAMPFRIKFSCEWLKTPNENGLNKVEFYFCLM